MQAQNIVKDDLLTGTDTWIDAEQWFQWLSNVTAFRYEGKGTNFNCNQRKNGKWYASKKIYSSNGCKLIALYIGDTTDCNLQRLQDIAEKFALNYQDFWRWYYGSERKAARKPRTKVSHNKTKTPEICDTDAEVLQSELARLQLALEEVTADRDRQLIRIAELQNRMHSEIQACTSHQRKQLEQLEAYNREIDRANGYLEKDNARLREENQKLKAEVELLRSQSIISGQENDQKASDHVWAVGSIKPRSELMRGQSRRQFEKHGNYPVLPDGSRWRRLGSKSDFPPSEQSLMLYQHYPANTIFYVCVG